ncbi:phage major tail tube protein [Vibrio hannami]|uniref:phage major tail tube protein n=1 Tax=Vibrio hannami TaxID=2717094 RepID=UPI00240F6091|nr:phage major tail tube protein [Vibrio hannami]MDG3089136.1 phage major tail tube protein [Vibrio hannami]
MAGGRTITHQKFLIGKLTISNEIEKFTAIKYKKKTGELKGSFIKQKKMLGYEALDWEITGKMLDESLATEVGKDGEKTIATYIEKGYDENGDDYRIEHIMTGECEIDTGDASNGEEKQATIKGVTVVRHKHTDTGKTITEVDIPNGDYFVNGRRIANAIK